MECATSFISVSVTHVFTDTDTYLKTTAFPFNIADYVFARHCPYNQIFGALYKYVKLI